VPELVTGGGDATKCQHGYWTHSSFNRCPWCHGFTAETADVVPVHGPGNGWLLRAGQAPCKGCGGPGNAGHGLLPSGVTVEWYEAHWKPKLDLCYDCSRTLPPDQVSRILRERGPMPQPPPGMREQVARQNAELQRRLAAEREEQRARDAWKERF
jgi:hypothetical protein